MKPTRKRVHVWPLEIVATGSRFVPSGLCVLFRGRHRETGAVDLVDWLNELRLRKMEQAREVQP